MTETELGQVNLTEKGSAAKERLPEVGRIQRLALTLIDNDEKRARFDRRIKGMCDGNPPYSSTRLKKLAQSDRCNINWMEGKAQHSTAMTPYTDLLRGSARMVVVRLNNEDAFLKNYWSEVVSEELDRALKEWRGFLYGMDLIMWDRLRYGKAFAMWPNKYDPEFFWVNRFNVHVPDTTRANVEELEVLVIEEKMPVDKLYRCSKRPGWNEAACIEAIKKAEPETSSSYEESRPDLTQSKINDRDILDGVSADKVHVAHVLQKEFDGRISYYVVTVEDGTKFDAWGQRKEAVALYSSAGEYEDWSHCFWATFHENCDGSWNGASGLGKDIIAQIDIKNRLLCGMVDNGFLRSMLTLQARTAADWAAGAVTKNMGRIMVIPPGHEAINTATYVGDMDGLIVLNREVEQTLIRNTGIYRPLPEKTEGQGNPVTATEAMIRAQQSTVLSNSAVIRFYSDLDVLYTEVYRRLVASESKGTQSKLKRTFLERCEERGVPIEVMREVDYVRAYRNIGNGSPAIRLQNIEAVGARSQMWPMAGQMAYERDRITAYMGAEIADAYFPKEQVDLITRDHQIAALENDSLVHGSPAKVSGEDNHVIHAQTHMEAAVAGLNSVQQGADPATVLAANDSLMPHAWEHIQHVQGNPGRKNEAKLLIGQWQNIAKANDQLRQSAERILEQRQKAMEAEQEAEAIRQRTDPKVLLEQARTQVELELAKARNEQAMVHHSEKHKQDLAIADASTAAQIQRDTAKVMAEIEQAKAKLELDIQTQLKKAESDAAAAKEKATSTAAAAMPALPEINIELSRAGEKLGAPKTITFERDKSGRIKSANVKVEVDGKEEGSKTVEFKRDKEGRIASAAVKSENNNKGE